MGESVHQPWRTPASSFREPWGGFGINGEQPHRPGNRRRIRCVGGGQLVFEPSCVDDLPPGSSSSPGFEPRTPPAASCLVPNSAARCQVVKETARAPAQLLAHHRRESFAGQKTLEPSGLQGPSPGLVVEGPAGSARRKTDATNGNRPDRQGRGGAPRQPAAGQRNSLRPICRRSSDARPRNAAWLMGPVASGARIATGVFEGEIGP